MVVINMKSITCASTPCSRPLWVPEETPEPYYCSVECEELCLKELASVSQTPPTSTNGSVCTGGESRPTEDATPVSDLVSD